MFYCEDNLKNLIFGNVSTFWLETVFIGDVFNCVKYTIGSNVGERSNYRNSFVFTASILQLSRFLLGNAIASFIYIVVSIYSNIVVVITYYMSIFSWGGWRSCTGDSQENSESNDLKNNTFLYKMLFTKC